MSRELMEVRSNTIAMEYLHDIAMDMPPIERSRYVNIVTEAITNNPDVQRNIVNKLSKQVEKLQMVDEEYCKKSAGNITKYPYYGALAKTIDILNSSEITKDLPNSIRMNKLHNILIENGPDFIWGYRNNDNFIVRVYSMLVHLLFITTDLAISEYVRQLEIDFKLGRSNNIVTEKHARILKDADRIIKTFESGQWRTIVMNNKRLTMARRMKALDEMDNVETAAAVKPTSESVDTALEFTLPTSITLPSFSSVAEGIWKFVAGTKIGWAIVIIGIIICYRDVAFFVARLGGKLANCFRHWAELIKVHERTSGNSTENGTQKQQKAYDALVGIADRIDAIFDKTNKESEKDIKEANREDFTTNEITQIDSIDFGV